MDELLLPTQLCAAQLHKLCLCFSTTQDITGKAVGIFLPISAFVSSWYEHSVANMFGVPMSIALGAPFNFWHFVAKNLVPVTIGESLVAVGDK